MSKKQTTRGGRRENAGRKAEIGEDAVTISFRVPQKIRERIDSARGNLSASEFLRQHLDETLPE